MAHSMLFFKNVKLIFWGDTVQCVIYLRNRCPSHALKDKTPFEMWFGRIPLVCHLNIFGCYALIPKK